MTDTETPAYQPSTAPPSTAQPSNAQPSETGPAPSTLVLLVRHGLTSATGTVLYGRSKGVHLSDIGKTQADEMARRVQALGDITAVYMSPLERTRETARPLETRLGLKAAEDKRLLEADFGTWTGRPLAELAALDEWKAVQRTPSTFRFPGGESFIEMQSRMIAMVSDVAQRHPGGRVVLVSHADPIKALITHLSGTPLDLFQRTVISPCSISAALIGAPGSGAAPIVLATNSTGDDLSGLRPA